MLSGTLHALPRSVSNRRESEITVSCSSKTWPRITDPAYAALSVTVNLPDGSQERFYWTNDTKFSGVLAPEARVTIRYAVSPDGKNLAQQISVSRG